MDGLVGAWGGLTKCRATSDCLVDASGEALQARAVTCAPFRGNATAGSRDSGGSGGDSELRFCSCALDLGLGGQGCTARGVGSGVATAFAVLAMLCACGTLALLARKAAEVRRKGGLALKRNTGGLVARVAALALVATAIEPFFKLLIVPLGGGAAVAAYAIAGVVQRSTTRLALLLSLAAWTSNLGGAQWCVKHFARSLVFLTALLAVGESILVQRGQVLEATRAHAVVLLFATAMHVIVGIKIRAYLRAGKPMSFAASKGGGSGWSPRSPVHSNFKTAVAPATFGAVTGSMIQSSVSTNTEDSEAIVSCAPTLSSAPSRLCRASRTESSCAAAESSETSEAPRNMNAGSKAGQPDWQQRQGQAHAFRRALLVPQQASEKEETARRASLEPPKSPKLFDDLPVMSGSANARSIAVAREQRLQPTQPARQHHQRFGKRRSTSESVMTRTETPRWLGGGALSPRYTSSRDSGPKQQARSRTLARLESLFANVTMLGVLLGLTTLIGGYLASVPREIAVEMFGIWHASQVAATLLSCALNFVIAAFSLDVMLATAERRKRRSMRIKALAMPRSPRMRRFSGSNANLLRAAERAGQGPPP